MANFVERLDAALEAYYKIIEQDDARYRVEIKVCHDGDMYSVEPISDDDFVKAFCAFMVLHYAKAQGKSISSALVANQLKIPFAVINIDHATSFTHAEIIEFIKEQFCDDIDDIKGDLHFKLVAEFEF